MELSIETTTIHFFCTTNQVRGVGRLLEVGGVDRKSVRRARAKIRTQNSNVKNAKIKLNNVKLLTCIIAVHSSFHGFLFMISNRLLRQETCCRRVAIFWTNYRLLNTPKHVVYLRTPSPPGSTAVNKLLGRAVDMFCCLGVLRMRARYF